MLPALVALLILPVGAVADSWIPNPLGVTVYSSLKVEGVTDDGVELLYRAEIHPREAGTLTVRVLLPEDAEVTSWRWSSGDQSVNVEPTGSETVTWTLPWRTYEWTQYELELESTTDGGVLEVELKVPVPHTNSQEAGAGTDEGVRRFEWPVPLQPNSGLTVSGEAIDVGIARVLTPDSLTSFESGGRLVPGDTKHGEGCFHDLKLSENLELRACSDGVELMALTDDTEELSSEWYEVTSRLGLPYVPAVAEIVVKRPEVRLELLVPERVEAGSEVTVFVRPYLDGLWERPVTGGTLRFKLRKRAMGAGAGDGWERELGEVTLNPEESKRWVEFRFRAPEEPSTFGYELIVEYEGPYGEGSASATFRVERQQGGQDQGNDQNQGQGGKRGFPVLVPPVIPPRRKIRIRSIRSHHLHVDRGWYG
ncbi:hypothetical protein [Methanopyrus kandleri]